MPSGADAIDKILVDAESRELRPKVPPLPEETAAAVRRVVAQDSTAAVRRRGAACVPRLDDHTEQVVDFQPVLAGELYGPLKVPAVFLQAHLDPEAGTLTWPNGADFDPAVLHDGPELRGELEMRAAAWGAIA